MKTEQTQRSTRSLNAQDVLLAALSLIPLILMLGYVNTFAADAPVNDSWEWSLQLASAIHDGTPIPWNIVYQGMNGHVIIPTWLLTMFQTVIDGGQWHPLREIPYNLAAGIGIFTLLLLIALRISRKAALIMALPFSLILFNFRGAQQWLSHFQNGFSFSMFWLLVGLCAIIWLRVDRWRTLIIAAVACFFASVSVSTGLLGWILLPLVAVMVGWRSRRMGVIWLVMTALCFALFLFLRSLGEGNRLYPPPTLLALIEYMAHFIANMFFFSAEQLPFAVWVGLGGPLVFAVTIVVFWAVTRRADLLAPFVMLALFAGASAFLSAIGRGSLYPNILGPALTSRYVFNASFFWTAYIGVMILSALYAKRSRALTILTGLHGVLLLVLVPIFIASNAIFATQTPVMLPYRADCAVARGLLLNNPRQCFPPSITYPNAEQAVAFIERQFGVFDVDEYRFPLILGALTVIDNPANIDVRYDRLNPMGEPEPREVLFQRAPTTVQQPIYVPRGWSQVVFESAVYVRFMSDAANLEDGIAFTVRAQTADGTTVNEASVIFDPRQTQESMAISLDLTALVGQTGALIFVADPRESSAHDTGFWIEPLIRLVDGG